MNTYKFYIRSLYLSCVTILMLGFSSCQIDEVLDPNGPSLQAIINNASRSDLQLVVTGAESLLRKQLNFYYFSTGIIGREVYLFTSADPRYTGELLGRAESVLDNAGFYGTRPYSGRYITIRNTNILIQAVTNNAQKLSLTTEEINGYNAFAHAIQAYELHLALNMQYQNGIRVDVADPDHLGPFLNYDQSLAAIQSLLTTAATELSNAGSTFPFKLSSGFTGFDTPATFRLFVKALAARISIYQGDKAAAATNLGESFLDVAGDLYAGPYRPYSTSSGDQSNEIYRTPNQSEAFLAHPSYVNDIEPGDDRISKVLARDTLKLDDLSSTYDCVVYPSLSSPISLIRNEELILIRVEARIGSNNTGAVEDLNVIRNAHGLPNYSGGTDDASLVDELLKQRRYSLYAEGHRWVDMRRYGRLSQLPIDRPGDDVWQELPRPVTEVQ
ncbi:MAG: RagB/SusD family nutrient uptake outer membrane protein [Saprospiraceae bacterium]|uniref:RagB/SusD family nutrient uptake outer membrane protein n=1 Tax=Candidatus Opimibacter skivensis TaxID=2982028 RepID=A0A9D7SUX4_9BACT|nr:RagB/SusD family nutrient uptake outer membrane protein [Candidatus Opimibacter skivensis]